MGSIVMILSIIIIIIFLFLLLFSRLRLHRHGLNNSVVVTKHYVLWYLVLFTHTPTIIVYNIIHKKNILYTIT